MFLSGCIPKHIELIVKPEQDRATVIETRFHMLCLDLVEKELMTLVDVHCVTVEGRE